jgi:cystathionine beta-lyase
MTFDPSHTPNRRPTNSIKWNLYPEDVLPLWVADTDFPAPAPIRDAIRASLEHGVLGYEFPTKALRQTVAARLESLYGWQVDPEAVVATPGIIAAFTAAAWAFCQSGDGFLIQPPVYPPFFSVSKHLGLVEQHAQLRAETHDGLLRYDVDAESFRAAFHSNARTRLFLLCNPHNPVGRAFTEAELRQMAETCLENETILVSDEIHSELLLDGRRHIPVATLSPEIAQRTVTLIAPSKTYNVPGLFCGFAIIPNPELREKFKAASERLVHHVSSLSMVAAQAAYSGACDDWLAGLLAYFAQSRDLLTETIRRDFPALRVTHPEATYMSWIDCSALVENGKIAGSPFKFFLNKAKVALTNGADFGPGYQNYVRLVFGCSQTTLAEGLARMKSALE